MLMGRFLLQIYIFPRHEQNICCFFFAFTYGLLLKTNAGNHNNMYLWRFFGTDIIRPQ